MTLLRVSAAGRLTVEAVGVSPYTVQCALGRSGVIAEASKREGDGATPAGRFQVRHLLFRSDRMSWPETRLPVAPLSADLGWSDDPADPKHYNAPVRLPYPHSHEKLWREDDVYDVIVVLGINDGPVVPGRGSALFFHLARAHYEPTEGCIAVARPDMLAILKDCGPETAMEIGLGD